MPKGETSHSWVMDGPQSQSVINFRCSVAKADCKYAESGRHHADPLDEVLKVKQERLEKWKTKISGEVTALVYSWVTAK